MLTLRVYPPFSFRYGLHSIFTDTLLLYRLLVDRISPTPCTSLYQNKILDTQPAPLSRRQPPTASPVSGRKHVILQLPGSGRPLQYAYANIHAYEMHLGRTEA